MALSQHLVVSSGDIRVKSWDVAIDEDWSPRVQATIVAAPSSTIEQLDPRAGARLQFQLHQIYSQSKQAKYLTETWAGLTAADLTAAMAGRTANQLTQQLSTPWNSFGHRAHSRAFDLGIRTREVNRVTGEIILTLQSDEKLLQDYGLVSDTPLTFSTTSVRTLVNLVLARIGAELEAGIDDYTLPQPPADWQPGVTAWSYLSTYIQTAGLKLWCDELRVWHLTSDSYIAPGLTSMSSGQSGGPITAYDTLDRAADWYDGVVVKYEWLNTSGQTQVEYDTAAVETGATRTLTLIVRQEYPGPGAARAILTRALRRGRRHELTAVSDYRSVPGQPLRISIGDSPVQTGFISSVRWVSPGDTMQLRSRDLVEILPDSWAMLPTSMTWATIPPDMTWADFTPSELVEEEAV